MENSTYHNKDGKKYYLTEKVGGGGEGAVYSIKNDPIHVAKLYFPDKVGKEKIRVLERKVRSLIRMNLSSHDGRDVVIAWPKDMLYDSQNKFVGYIMPKITAKWHLFQVSRGDDEERRKTNPHYTYKFAVAVAYNLSLILRKIHSAGIVVGDCNPKNILVSEEGVVTIIDTDSFVFTDKRTGEYFDCGVGMPEFLPPELQGMNLSSDRARFTEETDNFALSVHVFSLLSNNVHPFSGTMPKNRTDSKSMNPRIDNIVKGNCPYVTNGVGKPHPRAPKMSIFPVSIRYLFDKAFTYDINSAVKRSTIKNRPTALEWENALKYLFDNQLKVCRKNRKHIYPSVSPTCPWCKSDKKKPKNDNKIIYNTPQQPTPKPKPAPITTGPTTTTTTTVGSTITTVKKKEHPGRIFILFLMIIATALLSDYLAIHYLMPLPVLQTDFFNYLPFLEPQMIIHGIAIIAGVLDCSSYLSEEYIKRQSLGDFVYTLFGSVFKFFLYVAGVVLVLGIVVVVSRMNLTQV